MQIDLADNGCLTLYLSDGELAAMGLSFGELDEHSPRTRRMVKALLRMARRETGYDPGSSLLVEALPLDGGCLLLVTPSRPSAGPPDRSAPATFVTDADGLLQLASACGAQPSAFGRSSSLYRDGETYWLVIRGGDPMPALYECAEFIAGGEAAAAMAAEHGTPVFIGDALPRLHRLVCKD